MVPAFVYRRGFLGRCGEVMDRSITESLGERTRLQRRLVTWEWVGMSSAASIDIGHCVLPYSADQK
jgi:hypothetical protein